MSALNLEQFADLRTLATVFSEQGPYRAFSSPPYRTTNEPHPFELPLAGPALVAYWIQKFAPTLAEKETLRIVLVSPTEQAPELVDEACWYHVLPKLLGKTGMTIHLSTISELGPDTRDSALPKMNLPHPPATAYTLSLASYLEKQPDGAVDLVVLFDADFLISEAEAWADKLAAWMEQGTAVAAIASGQDELELITGLLGVYGFRAESAPAENRFLLHPGDSHRISGLVWGSRLWRVSAANRAKGWKPSEMLTEEVKYLAGFVRGYCRAHGAFPQLSQLGLTLSGPQSPASDGRALVVLPEKLYVDLEREEVSHLHEGDLVKMAVLDAYAKASALLATYAGREGRFAQILWAVRVFLECTQHIAEEQLGPDDDEDVCPHCGEVHLSEDDRTSAVKEMLSEILSEESPKVKLKAALELALAAVDGGGFDMPGNDLDETLQAEDLSDGALYVQLLERGYLKAAFEMWKVDPGLDEEGCDEEGNPLFLAALVAGDTEIVEGMLYSLEDFETEDEEGATPFHIVALMEEDDPTLEIAIAFFEEFLVHDMSPNESDNEGELPLETAAFTANWLVFEALLDIGADLDATELNTELLTKDLREAGRKELADKIDALRTKGKKPARKRSSRKTQS